MDVECRNNIIVDNISGKSSARFAHQFSNHVTSVHLHSENSRIVPLKLKTIETSNGKELGDW